MEMIGEEKKQLRKKAIVLRNSMIKVEIILWSRLQKRQVKGYKFRRQQPIYNYIVDFYCHEFKCIIEVDGEIHYLEEINAKDLKRDKFLQINGYHTLRLSNFEIISDINSTINKITLFISTLKSPS